MPELPEVETIKRVLEPQLAGRTIVRLALNRTDMIAHPSPEEFAARVTGARISGMGRRGKFLFLNLDSQDRIILHLRMTGQLLAVPEDFPVEKHTHVVFQLDNGQQLRFIDTRRFGRFWLLGGEEEDCFSGVQKLGVEPFDQLLTGEWLREQAGKRKKAVKECLLDQAMVAGIGNIYGDEILFEAKICPSRPACTLNIEEWRRLAEVIPAVMKKAIEDNRMSPEEYLAGKGKAYRNEPFLKVYGHEGEACPRCGARLRRIVLAGRSSVYCAGCQKEGPGLAALAQRSLTNGRA